MFHAQGDTAQRAHMQGSARNLGRSLLSDKQGRLHDLSVEPSHFLS